MKKFTAFNEISFYVCGILILVVGESFAIKSTMPDSWSKKNVSKEIQMLNKANAPSQVNQFYLANLKETEWDVSVDSVDFQVKVVKPRKFLLSFHKKHKEAFYIKIYDVIGNLIYQEVVSSRGRFKKEYDLSKYTTDLYVIKVSSGKTSKTQRLFLG